MSRNDGFSDLQVFLQLSPDPLVGFREGYGEMERREGAGWKGKWKGTGGKRAARAPFHKFVDPPDICDLSAVNE